MVEVLKTNVTNRDDAETVLGRIKNLYSPIRINFDLEDCDNILRIEHSGDLSLQAVIEEVKLAGFEASPLEDFVYS